MGLFLLVIIILLIILIVRVSRSEKRQFIYEVREIHKQDDIDEGCQIVYVHLSEEYDKDLLKYLKDVRNKSEFFKFAARRYIDRDT